MPKFIKLTKVYFKQKHSIPNTAVITKPEIHLETIVINADHIVSIKSTDSVNSVPVTITNPKPIKSIVQTMYDKYHVAESIDDIQNLTEADTAQAIADRIDARNKKIIAVLTNNIEILTVKNKELQDKINDMLGGSYSMPINPNADTIAQAAHVIITRLTEENKKLQERLDAFTESAISNIRGLEE